MEIEIKRSKPEKEESKYPYLGVTKDGIIVWFTAKGKGIGIKTASGRFNTDLMDWWEPNFTPVKKLTVEL